MNKRLSSTLSALTAAAGLCAFPPGTAGAATPVPAGAGVTMLFLSAGALTAVGKFSAGQAGPGLTGSGCCAAGCNRNMP